MVARTLYIDAETILSTTTSTRDQILLGEAYMGLGRLSLKEYVEGCGTNEGASQKFRQALNIFSTILSQNHPLLSSIHFKYWTCE